MSSTDRAQRGSQALDTGGFRRHWGFILLVVVTVLSAAATLSFGARLLDFSRLERSSGHLSELDSAALLRLRPFDPMLHLSQADAAATRGDLTRANQALTNAEQLAPNDAMLLRKRIALERALGRDAIATAGAMRLAATSPVDRSDAFAALQLLFRTPDGGRLLDSETFRSWPAAADFIAHACALGEPSAALLAMLASLSQHVEPTVATMNCISERATNEGNASAARWLWLSASAKLPRLIPHVFNGSFESEPTGSRFDWQLGAGGDFREGFAASIVPATTSDGQRALSIRFNGRPVRSAPAAQVIALPVGKYRLSYEQRETALVDSTLGVGLTLRCIPNSAHPDAPTLIRSRDSAPATPSTDWQRISADFSVTALCTGQQLTAEFAMPSAATLGRKGSVLIDNIRIEQLHSQRTATPAAAK